MTIAEQWVFVDALWWRQDFHGLELANRCARFMNGCSAGGQRRLRSDMRGRSRKWEFEEEACWTLNKIVGLGNTHRARLSAACCGFSPSHFFGSAPGRVSAGGDLCSAVSEQKLVATFMCILRRRFISHGISTREMKAPSGSMRLFTISAA